MSMKFSEYAKDVMGKVSAACLLYREDRGIREYFIVHPGGPYYTNKWKGYWSIPKGMAEEGEDLKLAARRELKEETGLVPEGFLTDLGTTVLNSGKIIHAFLAKGSGEWQGSNDFEMEWPPKSGKKQKFPEIDSGEWYNAEACKEMLGINQTIFIDRAEKILDSFK